MIDEFWIEQFWKSFDIAFEDYCRTSQTHMMDEWYSGRISGMCEAALMLQLINQDAYALLCEIRQAWREASARKAA